MSRSKLHSVVVCLALLFVGKGSMRAAETLSFEQLNWLGTGSSTPDSSWGRMTLDFAGYSEIQYFNLNVNGTWAVQNMTVGSLYGTGLDQKLTTMFDLGVPHGTDVSGLNYLYSIGPSPSTSIPTGTLLSAAVAGLDYQIGTEAGLDLGSPGAVDRGAGSTASVVKSAKLPNLDKFKNQVQKNNECAPGAISNSLNYLKDTGAIDFSETIDQVKGWSGWIGPADGTSSDWYLNKERYLEQKGMTVRFVDALLTRDKVLDLMRELEAGQDIEMDLAGHVEVLVGLRLKSDGTLDLDLFDDNQTDNKSDPLHTATLRGDATHDYVDGMLLERFVVECPVPEPYSVVVWTVLTGIFLATRCQRRIIAPCRVRRQ